MNPADAAGSAFDIAPCRSFSSLLDTCALPQAIDLTLLGAVAFDTDTGVLRSNGLQIPSTSQIFQTPSGEMRALIATQVIFRAGAQLRATGDRGFAIVASEGIALLASSLVDVSAGGAGSRRVCADGPQQGQADSGGAAGGGGGGFGGAGGAGGAGDADGGPSAGGARGAAAATVPMGVIGGCPGAAGGDQSVQNTGGAPGLGGGAIYLVSRTMLSLAEGAGLWAGGGGGSGGASAAGLGDAGGGGGGSGGLIFLEAPTILNLGILAANGGGGGEGSGDGQAGTPGAPGALGVAAAPGGQGGPSSGADGGAGGHRGSPAGATPAQIQNGGGGGGGGGAGIIRAVSANKQLGALVSPDPI